MNSRSSRYVRIWCPDSSGDCDSVSITSSGFSGISYGSETPVNSLISPERAFAYRPLTSRSSHVSTEALTYASMKRSPIIWRASSRMSWYGEMAAVITGTSLRESRFATNAIRRMFVSRSSFENPSPLERFSRTTSPSSTSSFEPRLRSSLTRWVVIVDLPEPESPVNHRQKPLSSAIVGVLLVSVDEDVGNLFPRELRRRLLAGAEHFPHLGTREEQVRLLGVGAGLRGAHALALVAPEGVLEEQRCDSEFVDVDVVEDALRVG